jgi:hypothetical protein
LWGGLEREVGRVRGRGVQKHTQIRRKVLIKNDQKHKFILHMMVMTTLAFERWRV